MSTKTLQFPPGPTSAKLRIIAPQHTPPRQILDAEGAVEVPDGGFALLEVGPGQLDVLSHLKPGDLHGLVLVDPGPGIAAALRPLDRVTLGLRGTCRPGAMDELAELEDLTSLELHGMALDGESADALAGMTRLRTLKLDGGADAVGAAAACRLTGLTGLVLSGEPGFSAGLARLSDLTQLEMLVLGSPDLDDSVFARVVGMSALRHLSLRSSGIRGRGIDMLAELSQLADLRISSPAFELGSLEGLVGSPSLARLAIDGIPAVGDEDASLLVALSPPLREASLGIEGHAETHPFSLSAQVWLARSRPELMVNGGFLSAKAIAKYVAAGLGTHPRTGGAELTP